MWLTTVTPSGAPLPRPVGFIWDGCDSVTVYNQPGARIRNIGRNPKVTLSFHGDPEGGDVVVLSGIAGVDESTLEAAQDPAYEAKYATALERAGMTAASFARHFSVVVRIRINAIRCKGPNTKAAGVRQPRRSRHLALPGDQPPPISDHASVGSTMRSWRSPPTSSRPDWSTPPTLTGTNPAVRISRSHSLPARSSSDA